MKNIADYIDRLRDYQTSLGNGRNLKSDDEKAAWWSSCTETQRCLSGLMNAPQDLERAQAKLADAEAPRPLVLKAQAAIDRLIEEACDYRTIADQRAASREWGRQMDLKAGAKALRLGVEYLGGYPCVPNCLKPLLGVTLAADGRELPNWFGSLPEIDAQIAQWSERRERAQQALDSWIAQAEQLLGAVVDR